MEEKYTPLADDTQYKGETAAIRYFRILSTNSLPKDHRLREKYFLLKTKIGVQFKNELSQNEKLQNFESIDGHLGEVSGVIT